MSNTSDYAMRIIGKEENIAKLVSWLKADENAEHHFYGIQYNSGVEDAKMIPCGDLVSFELNGRCSVSVRKCMLNQPNSYFVEHSYKEDPNKIALDEASRKLELKIEVISYEDCCNTSEHIIVDNGNLVVNEVVEGKDLLWDGLGEYYFTIGNESKGVKRMNIL